MTGVLVGIASIVLGAALTAAAITFATHTWNKRWSGPLLGGVPVRFAAGAKATPDLVRKLSIANDVITARLRSHGLLFSYRVEVVAPGLVRTPTVPTGKFPDGSLIGGSWKKDGPPLGKSHYIAVVVNERSHSFVAHEVLRHIACAWKNGGSDRDHKNLYFAQLETDAKLEIQERLKKQ